MKFSFITIFFMTKKQKASCIKLNKSLLHVYVVLFSLVFGRNFEQNFKGVLRRSQWTNE